MASLICWAVMTKPAVHKFFASRFLNILSTQASVASWNYDISARQYWYDLQNSSYLYCFHCTELNFVLRSHLANNMPDCHVAQFLPKYFICWSFTFTDQFKELSACWLCCHGLFPSKVKSQMTGHIANSLLYTPVIWVIWSYWYDLDDIIT